MVSVHESQTNGCLNYNGGCWEDKAANIIGCKDTFCGRVCECPLVQEVEFKGDVYSSCQACETMSRFCSTTWLEEFTLLAWKVRLCAWGYRTIPTSIDELFRVEYGPLDGDIWMDTLFLF
ncbi:uncharacterized protein LOC131239818 isoform X2 [Magnolia sinica]|uniref:uncharacterized protein LOC131239818 isoform X2 n=1 Tax=Magnolia sinica TaxID=86752 RepID=UPI0026589387|nr:uncharacterized protein LOC131239818 isoform X2 [Magnolia sinica]